MCFSGVGAVVLILIVLGTGYDYYLLKTIKNKKNVIYDLEKHGKLDHLTNGNGKVLNGKHLKSSRVLLIISDLPHTSLLFLQDSINTLN